MSNKDRRHIRFPVYATAAIQRKGNEEQSPIFTLVNNISLSGMGIYSYTPIKEDTPLGIELSFLGIKKRQNKDAIEGHVAWMGKEGDLYFIGICFDEEINPDKHPNLYRHFSQIIKGD